MKHEKQKHYDLLLEQHTITENLLFAIVAANEPKISKAAYDMKKFKNTDSCGYNLLDSANFEFKKHIGIRNSICKALKSKYTQSDVKSMAAQVSKDDYPAQRIIDLVLEMLKSGKYTLSADS
ncbi:MAG: hypothetical protein RR764_07775 [Oscillospiraceae bacterium]